MAYKDIGLGLGAFAAGVVAFVGGAAFLGRVRPQALAGGGLPTPRGSGGFGTGEHEPTDLLRPDHPGFGDRAVDAFRPDPTAPMPEGEREALRPASLGPVSTSPLV